MTQYPPQTPPSTFNPAAGVPQGPPAKPGSITVLAVLAIVVGALGALCCGVVNVAALFTQNLVVSALNLPPESAPKLDPSVVAFDVAVGVADLLTCGVLLVVGIGALRLSAWARGLGVLDSIAMLVIAVVFVVGTLTFTGAKREQYQKDLEAAMVKAANAKGGNAAPTSGMATFGSAGTLVTGAIMFMLRILVPLGILIFWTKPAVKAAFANRLAYSGSYPYGTPPPNYPPT